MITIKNFNKLPTLFKSKLVITESDTDYLIRYYYPTLPTNSYYRITLSRINPPQKNHEHKDEYLMLCGECCYWLSKKELENIDDVYEAIIDVAARHNFEITGV